jgi:hypothetical protein
MSNVLHRNCLYFQIPEDLITHRIMENMKESELKLYLALLYQAQRYSTTTPKLTGHEFIKVSSLAKSSATTARKSLVEHGLIRAKRGVGNAYSYELMNAITGRPMTNYLKRGAPQSRSDGLSFLARKLFNLPREEYERYYRSRLDGAEIINTANGLSSHCPFHDDRSPSLEIGLNNGVWYCHGCGEGKGMVEFERRLTGLDAPSALQSVASFLGLGPPESIEEAPIAEYDYTDEAGELLYQVVRYPDEEGKKQIRVRSPDFSHGEEWRWDSRRPDYAHRVAWESVHGPVPTTPCPDGSHRWELHHTCLNRSCVNPAHIQLVTHREHTDIHNGIRAAIRFAKAA